MRSVRQVRRHGQWEVDGGDFPHAPDAEATPMISQPHPWNSFFPRNATDRQHPSSRIRVGMVTPAITTAIRSIQRLFGRGPVPVSRGPAPETFDLESSDSETDPFDTLRSNSSRAKLNPFANSKQNAASGSDRGASSYTLSHPSDGTRDSPILDAELDGDRGLDQGVVNGVGGGNAIDDHDSAGDFVILITRNGEDFSSSGGTLISMRGDRRAAEVDQSSIEVTPPTPTLNHRVSTFDTAMPLTRRLTVIMSSAFPCGRLPYEKCFHTSFSLPLLRPSHTTLVLPFNRRLVKSWRSASPSTTSAFSFVSEDCFRGLFTPLRQGRPSCSLLHGGGTAHRPCGKGISSLTRPHNISSHIAQPALAPDTWCLLPSRLTTSTKLHAVVSGTVAAGFSVRPARFGAIESDQRVGPTKLDPVSGARCWLQPIPATCKVSK